MLISIRHYVLSSPTFTVKLKANADHCMLQRVRILNEHSHTPLHAKLQVFQTIAHSYTFNSLTPSHFYPMSAN